jgi:hypothetical protein
MRNSTISKLTGGAAAAALVLTGALGATAAQAQGISGVTSCAAPGGKQEGGALIGALLGAALGSNLAKNDRGTGTAIGAVAGAAAGSAIGCQMQHKSQDQAYGYGQPATYTSGAYRLSSDIRPASFARAGGTMVATTNLKLRSAPSTRGVQVGGLRAGQRFQALAYVRGSQWILVGQGGVGVGYVHGAYAQPEGYRYAAY